MGFTDPKPRTAAKHKLTRDQYRRFLRNTRRNEETGCLEWMGATRKGYGLFLHRRAHKVWWEHHNGPVPPRMDLAHKCSNKRCVEFGPEHVRPLTHQENMAEDSGKVLLTHCSEGHELTEDNVYRQPGREYNRQCKKCRAKRQREAYLRDKQRQRGTG